MVAATGALASSAAPVPQGGGSTGGLDAQLARYQKQLSECINCASSKTPEGRREIDDLYGKIHDLQARIEEARGGGPVFRVSSTEQTAGLPGATASTQGSQPEQGASSRRATIYDTVGSVIDTYG